jgi:hypothetical protein
MPNSERPTPNAQCRTQRLSTRSTMLLVRTGLDSDISSQRDGFIALLHDFESESFVEAYGRIIGRDA